MDCDATSAGESMVLTRYSGGLNSTLNVTLPKFRSYAIPYPPRMLVRPSPFTSQAKPIRGAKLFRSGAHREPIGLVLLGNTVPPRTLSMICCGVLVLTETLGSA